MKEATLYADPFSINTARGASSEEMRAIHKVFIYEALTHDERKTMLHHIQRKFCPGMTNETRLIEKYLLSNHHYGCSHPEFDQAFGTSSYDSISFKKRISFRDATTHASYLFSLQDV
jgi:hypothetical protein